MGGRRGAGGGGRGAGLRRADDGAGQAGPGRQGQAGREGQGQTKERSTTLQGRIAAETKLAEDDVDKVLAALGPALREDWPAARRSRCPASASSASCAFAEHRDLVNGRPALIEASNYVEFLPSGGLVDAANAPGAVPQDTVQPFEFNPLPGQTKSLLVPDDRMPNVRVP